MIEADLSIIDLRGYEVSCSGEILEWLLHRKHPEIVGLVTRKRLELSISNPQYGIIFSSNHDNNCAIYYKKFRNLEREIKTVVRFDDKNVGKIVSTCLVDKRASGEKIIWPPNMV